MQERIWQASRPSGTRYASFGRDSRSHAELDGVPERPITPAGKATVAESSTPGPLLISVTSGPPPILAAARFPRALRKAKW